MQAAMRSHAVTGFETLCPGRRSTSASKTPFTQPACQSNLQVYKCCSKGYSRNIRSLLNRGTFTRTNAIPNPIQTLQTRVIASSGKGFGPPPPSRSGGSNEQETIKQARNFQLEATQLFAQLLESKDLATTARENVNALTEEFFMIASTYLDLAKKEGNAEVVNQLESTLKVALAEKEKTLRPEIRLLNRVLREKTSAGRAAIFQEDLSLLASEDGYFAGLVKRMQTDVEKQHENPRKGELLAKLKAIRQEAKDLSRTKK